MTDAELDQCRRDGALLRSLVSQRVKLRRAGREWKGCCPFHEDDTPSFVVYDDGHYHCYGCGAHGTVFDFVKWRDGVGFPEAAKRVAAEIGGAPSLPKRKPTTGKGGNGKHAGPIWQPILPPPADAPLPAVEQLRCDTLHEYRDADGRVLCYVRRFEAKPGKGKLFLPLTYGVLDGKTGWHDKAPDKPKPLYGLNRLAHAPDAVVLLCEGEKAADAAQRLFPHHVAMSWMGGAKADGGADVAPLDGRSVILWGDADEVGGEAVARLMKRLPEAHLVDTAGLPDGYDAADLESDCCADLEGWLLARKRAPVRDPETEPEEEPEPEGEEEPPSGAKPIGAGGQDGEGPTQEEETAQVETKPDGADGQDEATSTPEPEGEREQYGPPTLADLTIDDLADLDELICAKIVKAKAALLEIAPGALTALVKQKRAAKAKAADDARKKAEKAAKAAADAAAKAAKAKADAEAKAIKEAKKAADDAVKAAKAKAEKEAKAREKTAKTEREARERARKRADAEAKKKERPTLQVDQDDGLGSWLPPTVLPEIIVEGGERPAIADAGLAAMAAARVPFYQRGKDLVRVCVIKLKLSNGQKVRVPAISIVTRPMLMRALGLCAKWLAFNKQHDLVQIDPPTDLGDHILGMIGEWPFPPLRGVIATQTMRYDGSLLTTTGYDPVTGLVLFNPPPMPVIPDKPTKQDALEALALLRDLLIEVDFAEDGNVSLSGAVSMLMTPVLRGMMAVAPMHVVSKPVAGSGGSYMGDITAAIAIGERCPVLSLTLNNDEENEKRLSSAALTGQPIIAIDNFTGTLMGDFLCQLIERPMPQVRLLGKSELVTVANHYCVIANGNNVTIGADTVRRTVQISLDADTEDPTTRVFTRNPVAEVLADRGRYVAAILTIARAYRVAGSPGKLPPRLSFDEWSDNVRSALVWLGWSDPDQSIKAVRDADPISAKLHAVIAAWATDLTVGHSYYTSELVAEASECIPHSADRIRPALWDALFAVAGNKTGHLDWARLGQWLQAHLNRISAGYKLLVDRTNKARPRWLLEPR